MSFSRFSAVVTLSVVLLSGCTSINHLPNAFERAVVPMNNQSMPKGYKYQDNTPISSPAPSSPWVNSSVIHNTDNLSSNIAAWQGAVYELVAQLEPQLPKDGTPLNLYQAGNQFQKFTSPTGANNSLDHYLRQILMQHGYNLTTAPQAGLPVAYAVKEQPKQKNSYVLMAAVMQATQDGELQPRSVVSVPAVVPFE